MTAKEFLDMVNRGNDLQDGDLMLALQLSAAYPYFSIPCILAARIAVRQKNESATECISNAAIRVPNRKRLKELVYGDWDFIPATQNEPTLPAIEQEEEEVPQSETQPEASPATKLDVSTPDESDNNPQGPEQPLLEQSPIDPISKRQQVLKQLEENLSKLQENSHGDTSIEPESEKMRKESTEEHEEQPADELIEAIKKKKKKEIPSEKRKEQIALINRFAKKNTRLAPLANPTDPIEEPEDLSISSTQLNDSMVSESFAKILVKQKKLVEAIAIYEKLQLKYPDKKAYFADCINELEKK
ncbi:MAG: hypothetical protein JJU34_15945 [Lunatimonas sp.]|uniref:hypothetical protein n=1 Tax=Lunatimonas sp. TaxID=2060141 RepID=UPI00263B87A3|nr:hypothetical protein [Lunatimonas sp.]MCC5938773.1 hypothetical protein [Lunatimonas sp.]